MFQEVAGLSNLNRDIIVSFHFEYNNTLADITKNDLEVSVLLEGRNSPTEQFKVVTQNTTIFRELNCINGYSYYFQLPGPNGNILKIYTACEKIIFFHITHVGFSDLRASLAFHNMKSIYEKGMITGDILTEVSFISFIF